MTRNSMFMITEGLLWFAFGYAVQGMNDAALFFTVCAVVIAAGVHIGVPWKPLAAKACAAVFTALAVLHVSGLKDLFPTLPVAVTGNILAGIWFLENGTEDLKQGLRIALIVTVVMFFLALAIPANAVAEMIPDGQRAFADLILLLLLIFIPGIYPCLFRMVRRTCPQIPAGNRTTQE